MTRDLWLLPLLAVPILPKIKAISAAGVPIMLDDFALALGVVLGFAALTARASSTGVFKISLPWIGLLFFWLVWYKSIDLGAFLFLYPAGRVVKGGGMAFEGILVVAKTLAFFFVYTLLYTRLNHLRALRFAIKVYVFVIAVVVAVALMQFFILGHRVLSSTFRHIYVMSQSKELIGVQNPWLDRSAVGHEHLGAYMILSVSLLGGMLLYRWPTGRCMRYLAALLWAGCVFTLVFTSSRGAWIGGGCALCAFVWTTFRRREASRLFYALLGAFCGFIAFELWWEVDISNYIAGRVVNLVGIITGGASSDYSAMERIGTYRELWNMFLMRPLLGWGPGGAGRVAEGQFIRELVEGGTIGGLLFLAIMIQSIRIALRCRHLSRDPMIRGASIGFICGMVGLLGQSFFTELFILTKIGVPFWVLSAIVHRLYSIELKRSRAT